MIRRQSAVSIIFAVFALLLLSVVTIAVFSLISTDVDTSANDVRSSRAFNIAEGGVQFGAQAVQDDISAPAQTTTPTSNGYCAIAYLEGGYYDDLNLVYCYSGSGGVSNPRYACMHGQDWDINSTSYYCNLGASPNGEVRVWNFQARINDIGTRLRNVRVITRGRKNPPGGTSPVIQIEYSTNAGSTWTAVGSTFTLSSTSFTYYYSSFTTQPTWSNIMNFANFMIRARITNNPNRSAWIDWLALEVTYEVDALSEPWGHGSYATFPAALGDGTIESVTISDESAKININYASQILLQRLMEYDGIPTGDAATLAANIISYRGVGLTNPFNMIEELKQVAGMTTTYYDAIDQDVTVHSWVNNAAQRPAGSRAPVNINTASRYVLRAIFRTAISDTSDVNTLADNVIAQRGANPFTHFFSSYSQQNIDVTNSAKSFSYFLQNQAYYLSNVQMMDIREVADGSQYNIVYDATSDSYLSQTWADYDGSTDSTGTELSYYSNTFLITCIGHNGSVDRQIVSSYGHIYTYADYSLASTGTTELPVYIGESPAHAYWREIRN